MLNARSMICFWTVNTHDTNKSPVTLTFDFTNDEAPFTIVFDLQQYFRREFSKPCPVITYLHPKIPRQDRFQFTYTGRGVQSELIEILLDLNPGLDYFQSLYLR